MARKKRLPQRAFDEPVREEPDEALIRAFEAEMAKAGAIVHTSTVRVRRRFPA